MYKKKHFISEKQITNHKTHNKFKDQLNNCYYTSVLFLSLVILNFKQTKISYKSWYIAYHMKVHEKCKATLSPL